MALASAGRDSAKEDSIDLVTRALNASVHSGVTTSLETFHVMKFYVMTITMRKMGSYSIAMSSTDF